MKKILKFEGSKILKFRVNNQNYRAILHHTFEGLLLDADGNPGKRKRGLEELFQWPMLRNGVRSEQIR